MGIVKRYLKGRIQSGKFKQAEKKVEIYDGQEREINRTEKEINRTEPDFIENEDEDEITDPIEIPKEPIPPQESPEENSLPGEVEKAKTEGSPSPKIPILPGKRIHLNASVCSSTLNNVRGELEYFQKGGTTTITQSAVVEARLKKHAWSPPVIKPPLTDLTKKYPKRYRHTPVTKNKY